VRDGEAEATPMSEAEVQGWAVWSDARPPALAVAVSLELVDGRDGTGPRRLLLRAVRPVSALAVAGSAVLASARVSEAAS